MNKQIYKYKIFNNITYHLHMKSYRILAKWHLNTSLEEAKKRYKFPPYRFKKKKIQLFRYVSALNSEHCARTITVTLFTVHCPLSTDTVIISGSALYCVRSIFSKNSVRNRILIIIQFAYSRSFFFSIHCGKEK